MRIRDPGWRQFGSGIRDKHPGSATLGSNLINAEVCCKVVILVGESLDPALQVADLGQQAVDLFTLPAGLVHLT